MEQVDPSAGDDAGSDLLVEAQECIDAGRYAEADELLHKVLAVDLRCLEAHALLGERHLSHWRTLALHHFELGVAIGSLTRVRISLFDGILLGKSHLIMDRDPVFTADFRGFLKRSGVVPLRLPARSPNLNAYAERFVRSVRRECLDHFVVLGERHLRHVLLEYLEHYNRERPHQGIGNVLIRAPPRPANDNGPIKRRQRLGGVLNYYHREAA